MTVLGPGGPNLFGQSEAVFDRSREPGVAEIHPLPESRADRHAGRFRFLCPNFRSTAGSHFALGQIQNAHRIALVDHLDQRAGAGQFDIVGMRRNGQNVYFFHSRLHLLFEFAFVDMILESLVAVDEHDRNLFAVLTSQVRIGFDIDDPKIEGDTPPNAFDDVLGFVAQMTAGTGIDFNLNRAYWHLAAELQAAEEFLRALDIDRDLCAQVRPANRTSFRRAGDAETPGALSSASSGTGPFKHERFDRQICFIERRTDADIGHGIHERTAIQRNARDIDADSSESIRSPVRDSTSELHRSAAARA